MRVGVEQVDKVYCDLGYTITALARDVTYWSLRGSRDLVEERLTGDGQSALSAEERAVLYALRLLLTAAINRAEGNTL